jgi:peptide/nickel transport system substrate-binding protein
MCRSAAPNVVRANDKKAWFGWPSDDKLEALREQWLDETDTAKQIQTRCLDLVTVIPLGQYLPPEAWRAKISTPLTGLAPVFWNVTKN